MAISLSLFMSLNKLNLLTLVLKLKTFLLVLSCFATLTSSAQLSFESFNAGLPSNWTTGSGSAISLNSEHYKGGKQALKWNVQNGGQLTISNLAIPSSSIGSSTSSSAQFFVYSKEVSNDTLVFQFLDNAGVVQREGKMLLNYKGWRDYHRSYRYDYNNGNEMPAFALNQCNIIYKASQSSTSKTVWFDEMRFIGDSQSRFPGPHMVLDAKHFNQTASTAGGDAKLHLINWGAGPDIPVAVATTAEKQGLQLVKTFYNRSIPSVTASALQAAKDYVTKSGITRNADNTIKGRAIAEALLNQDTLIMLSNHCGSLARAFVRNNDADAKAKLLLFTEYLLDQGLAEGGRIVITTNTYNDVRDFPIGFLEALDVYPTQMRNDVLKMLKWAYEFNIANVNGFIERLNLDYIYLKSRFLVELALAEPTDVAVRDLKLVKRLLESYAEIGDGGRGGIKIDGLGFHHRSHLVPYLGSYSHWILRAFEFKGTPFKIKKGAYDNMSLAITTLFLETSEGTLYPHSVSGRSPFPGSVPVKASDVIRLVEVGGDIIGTPFEPRMAAFYNYIFGEKKYAVPAVDFDGFYQFNYAQMGVLRKNNWVAVMRGFTDKMFGAEIYANQNSYGRYQSYGSLEVLYDGTRDATGYTAQGDGWDWNVMPGTTTIHLPYSSLKASSNSTRTEYQTASFAGSLSSGKDGVFGMDFVQKTGAYATNNFRFRKSVFAFDDILVCLGSDISTESGLGNVATNLFQGATTGSNPPIYVNSTSATSTATYSQTLSTSTKGVWLLNAQTTGYYIPKGNGDITVKRGSQTSPVNTSYTGTTTATANASKAWINHGDTPKNGTYHFVAVPATTPVKMQALASQFEEQKVYEVLSQTKALHAVKYLPKKITSYVFFEPQTNVNIGAVKGISAGALVSVKEVGDSLIVCIANPDLNTVSVADAATDWNSAPSSINLKLSSGWMVVDKPNSAVIDIQDDFLGATFILNKGIKQVIKLLKKDIPIKAERGTWNIKNTNWNYSLAIGTVNSVFTSSGSSSSVSSNSAAGFMPSPTVGLVRVGLGTTGNGSFRLIGNASQTDALLITANAASLNKFSAYALETSAVSAFFMDIKFGDLGDNGTWDLVFGNNLPEDFFDNESNLSNSSANKAIFTGLKFDYSSSGISLKYREGVNNNQVSYANINDVVINKGTNNMLEVYCNNLFISHSYTRAGDVYVVEPGSYHVWVNGLRAKTSSGSFNLPATSELASKLAINAFGLVSYGNTLPSNNSATVTVKSIGASYLEETALPLEITAFAGKSVADKVELTWSAVNEEKISYYVILSSTDGVNYSQVGAKMQVVINTSGESKYSFNDTEDYSSFGTVHYQLKSFDLQGKESLYPKVVVVDLKIIEKQLHIIPNPVFQSAELQLYSDTVESIVVEVINSLGQTVYKKSEVIVIGLNRIRLESLNFNPGPYHVVVSGKAGRQFVKIIKMQ